MAGGIAALRGLLAAGAEDGAVAFDLVTLLQRAGRSAEAADLFIRTDISKAPDYALLAGFHANRDAKRQAEAERLARLGMVRFPGDPAWRTRLALALTDAGRPQEAIQLLGTTGTSVERLMAQGYAYRRAGDLFAALRVYGTAARLAPGNREAIREVASILTEIGAPHAAERVGGPNPSVEAAKAAAMVRWGEDVKPRDPARRFDGTDQAIVRLDQLLQTTTDADIRRRLRDDRIIALRDRFRMEEVVREVEAIQDGGPLPTYVEEAYADALLYLRRPKEALGHYESVLQKEPRNVQARYGQFYSAVESEDFTKAYAAVDLLLRDEPVWRVYPGDATRYPNPDRTVAEVADARARLYGGEFSQAWSRISTLSDAAPASADVRLTAAQVAAARGWKRKAEEEAQIGASLAPEDRASKLALLDSLIAAYRYKEADRLLAELVALYPEDWNVRRAARLLDAEHRWLLEGDVRFGLSSGGGVNAAGQEMVSTARLYTPPLADNWRLFGMTNYAFAHPIEGFVSRAMIGGGVELRLPYVKASVAVHESLGTYSRVGGSAMIDWAISDKISVGASAELFSVDTPLRALFYGITSDEYAVRAAYRWHEERKLSLVAAYQPFTDGNQRLSAGLAFQQRLVTVPHFWLTGLAELYASTNALTNVPYYSPAADLTATVGLLAEHVLWRSYDRSLTQALQVQGGLYSERGYGESWLGVASYEHRWRFDPYTEFRYGVQVSRRTYDGSEFRELAFIIGLRQRI
ncbi:poly-beta-1,6 N-acetyl-D-glucosamine export porin PgaA [soil metagenome]